MNAAAPYPVRVDATLEPRLSRWLWLVKWLLVIPHYVVLVFLWTAFVLLSVVAFFGILFTGSYPRSIFEFNVGVLRWSWRVAYYAYGALGTDRYPPFTLAEVPDYPTHLEIDHPEHLSRALVLVKWWLLAIPHYLILAVFLGGGTVVARNGAGLIVLLVLIAGVVLAVSGRYPRGIFDLVLGLNRWVLRVAAYAALMTDAYPPFRLDMGGDEPGGTLTLPTPPTQGPTPPSVPPTPPVPRAGEPGTRGGWNGARIVSLVVGSLLVLGSLGLLASGGALLWADRVARDGAGFIHTPFQEISTGTYALVTQKVELGAGTGLPGSYPQAVLGKVRVQVVPTGTDSRLFVGIAPTARATRYLRSVERGVTTDLPSGALRTVPGGAPSTTPQKQDFWTASSVGAGPRTIVWTPKQGTWTVVVMNADARRGLNVQAQVGATIPALPWIAGGLLVVGVVVLAIGAVLVVVPIVRASRHPAA